MLTESDQRVQSRMFHIFRSLRRKENPTALVRVMTQISTVIYILLGWRGGRNFISSSAPFFVFVKDNIVARTSFQKEN